MLSAAYDDKVEGRTETGLTELPIASGAVKAPAKAFTLLANLAAGAPTAGSVSNDWGVGHRVVGMGEQI